MTKVNIHGTFFNATGYDHHSLSLLKALVDLGVEVSAETQLPQNWQTLIPDKYHQCFGRVHPRWPTVMIGLPHSWKLKLADKPKKFYGFFVWESLKIPEHFAECIKDERISKILVPSSFVKLTVDTTLLKDVACVIPHGVDSNVFIPKVEPKKEGEPFTFLFSKGWSGTKDDRNGLDVLMRAWCRAFKKGDNVRLLVKINPAYAPAGINFLAQFQSLWPETKMAAEIGLVYEAMPYEAQVAVYHQADCFVFPSLGEGFGMTALEAMSCGLPVIASKIGGQTDFVNEENGWLIDYTIIPTPVSAGLLYEGTEWYEPKVEELVSAMREAYEHPEETAVKGLLGRKTALEFSWESSARKLLKLVEKDED